MHKLGIGPEARANGKLGLSDSPARAKGTHLKDSLARDHPLHSTFTPNTQVPIPAGTRDTQNFVLKGLGSQWTDGRFLDATLLVNVLPSPDYTLRNVLIEGGGGRGSIELKEQDGGKEEGRGLPVQRESWLA